MAASGGFGLRYKVDVVWVPAGAGGMQQADAQVLTFFPSASNPAGLGLPNVGMGQYSSVPGGSAPTQANFDTAVNNMLTDIEAQIAANLARIQAFASGSG